MLLLFMSVTTQAKEKQYNVKEFQTAYSRYLQVSNDGDAKRLKHFADSVRKAGKETGNYRVEMLYYSSMNVLMYREGVEDSVRIKIFEEGRQRAKELGTDLMYWRNYSSLVVNYIYIDPVKALDMADQMLKEATKTKSTMGLIHSYYAMGYTYAMRGETMMAVSVLEKAQKLGEAHIDDNEVELDLHTYIYDMLAQCYAAIPVYDKALSTYDKMIRQTRSGKINTALSAEDQILNINCSKALIYFDAERYKEFGDLLAQMRKNPSFEDILNSDNDQLRLCVMLYDGKDHEAWQMIEQLSDPDDRHNFLYVYYKFKGDYGKAMKEWESMLIARDSALFKARLTDMEVMDSKIGNEQLRREQEQLKNRQRMIILGSAGFVLLLVVIFLLVIYVRTRKHSKVLEEKNVQLDIARKDAEKHRDEAEQARDDAEVARDEAVRANKVKTHFIQNMTHEIHTPLNAINGFAQILTEPSMQGMFGEEELMEMYTSIGDSAMNLSSLVDNIITITDSESTQERSVIRPVNLRSLVDTVMAEEKQPDTSVVNYHADLSALPEDFSVLTNEGHLKQILDKLLHNAIKFTQQGEICVTAHIDEDYVTDISQFKVQASRNKDAETEEVPLLTDSKGALFIYVRDTGPGIPEGKEDVIFERFKKLDEYVPGTGLGLSVCRALAPRIYGDVYCDMTQTKEGEGSVFVVRIPLHTAPFELTGNNFSYNEMLGCY